MTNRNKYSEGYSAVDTTLLEFKADIGPLLWNTYRMTWPSIQNVPYNPKSKVVRDACFDIIENRALPTPKESIYFNFEIKNISRVCLAQITRGRIGWWFNVESQMPEYLNHGVTIPKNLYNSKYKDRIVKLIEDSQKLYDDIADEKYPPQDLRYLCLHGQQTSMIASTNYTALTGFFTMRAENGLTDELNLVARQMKKQIKDRVWLMGALNEIDVLERDLWEYMLEKLDCLGANRKVCLINDKVFGNTGRYPSEHENVPSQDGKIKPDFDFKKSAWYLELLEMDERLLFPDEKEMIERWKDE